MTTRQAKGVSLSFLCILLVLPDFMLAYPVFGTKRYGRSTGLPHRVSTWGIPAPYPLQAYQPPQPRSQPHFGLAPNYYTPDPIVNYPYAQDYHDTDYYYTQEPSSFATYPYYPVAANANGNMKYSVYQSGLPYYYGDGRQRPSYGYYGYEEPTDPVDDLQEEIQQEEEREEREDALPIGQETWYEGGGSAQRQADSIADVNAAFLQNLIMNQMYNDANNGHIMRHPQYAAGTYSVVDDGAHDSWMYDTGAARSRDYYPTSEEDLEDEDVRELKSLVKKNRSGDYSEQVGTDASNSNWFPTRQQDRQEQAWYAPADSTHRPEYYEPIWFPTENGPWYENSWNSGMSYKRNSDSAEQNRYQSIKAFNKKQESSDFGPWIAKGSLNFSDRKGNGILAPVNKPAKTRNPSKSKKAPSSTVAPKKLHPSTTTSSTPAPTQPTSTPAPDFDARRGQKEVALLRPPTPVRHPFTVQTVTRSRPDTASPRHTSVYDTIKQLLNMEQSLRKESAAEADHARPQKRFVSNEENLVEELSGLKKMAA